MDWKTVGHNIADKKRKNSPSMGAREAGTQLSLSLFFFLSTSASLTPFCSQSISRTSHVCAVTVRMMELLEYHNHSHRQCLALLATSCLDLRVIEVQVQCLKKGQPMSPAGHITSSHSGEIVTITLTDMTQVVIFFLGCPLFYFLFFLLFQFLFFYFLHSRPPSHLPQFIPPPHPPASASEIRQILKRK